MNIFGIGLPELAVIAAIGLLVFGPKRLPELGRTLGRTLKGFQSASSEFEKELRTAIATAEQVAIEPSAADPLVTAPLVTDAPSSESAPAMAPVAPETSGDAEPPAAP